MTSDGTQELNNTKIKLKGYVLEIPSTIVSYFEFGIEARQSSQNIAIKPVILKAKIMNPFLIVALKFLGQPK